MLMQSDDRVVLSRPKDRSLEAYKAWITEIANRLTTSKAILNLTDAEWREYWREFWRQKQRQ